MDEAEKATEALDKELREKVEAFLTPEQKDQMKKDARKNAQARGGEVN